MFYKKLSFKTCFPRKKAVFLDRDGTINVDKGYLHRTEDFEFLPGAVEALGILQRKGFALVVVTNQSGIARGFYTESEYFALNAWMLRFLASKGISIALSLYCPHLPDAPLSEYRRVCTCRKPGTGLFEQAAAKLDIDMESSFAIGDRERDICICKKSGTQGFVLYADREFKDEEKNVRYIRGGLLDASKIIETVLEGEEKNACLD